MIVVFAIVFSVALSLFFWAGFFLGRKSGWEERGVHEAQQRLS